MASVSELTGKTIGGYRLERLIGEGAMGPVYAGKHRDNGHQAAVKVIPSKHLASRSLLERFVNDQKLLARQHYPGLVEIFDAGKVADLGVYMVMEQLGGNPLSELLLASQGGMLVQRALRITEGICAALEAAHEVGVLHRNLKPSNVFVTTQGKRVFVKLIDFGVNALPPLPGQHDYRAPEQVQNFPINEGADLWAVGAMLFEMLTDKKVSHKDDPPPSPSQRREGISEALDSLVQELLARFPEGRPGRAKQVREACAQLRADLPSESGMLPVVTAAPTATMRAPTPAQVEELEPITQAVPTIGKRPPLAEMDSPLHAQTRPSRPVAAAVEISEAISEVDPSDAATVIPPAALTTPRSSGSKAKPVPSSPRAAPVAIEKATPSKAIESGSFPKRTTGEQLALPPVEAANPWPKRIAAWTLGPLALAIGIWFWNQPIRHYSDEPVQEKTVKATTAPFDPSAPVDEDELPPPDEVKSARSTVSADKPVLKKRNRR